MQTPDLPSDSAIETVVTASRRDLGDGFVVQRALPAARRRMIGPFVFFDHFGPTRFEAGQGLDVRPHPHIGIAAVTYLFEGELLHRDSTGAVQAIRPGAVNWMTAGRGIAHSERTPEEARSVGGNIFGVQIWLALPRHLEETAPSFTHHDTGDLPVIADGGTTVRLIAGALYGVRSPVHTLSDLFYADAALESGASLPLSSEHRDRAIYVAAGRIEIEGQAFERGQLVVLHPGRDVTLRSTADTRALLFGGEPMDGPRHMWWNFVSSSRERIEQAKADWQAGRFTSVPQESDPIPLPVRGSSPVLYP